MGNVTSCCKRSSRHISITTQPDIIAHPTSPERFKTYPSRKKILYEYKGSENQGVDTSPSPSTSAVSTLKKSIPPQRLLYPVTCNASTQTDIITKAHLSKDSAQSSVEEQNRPTTLSIRTLKNAYHSDPDSDPEDMTSVSTNKKPDEYVEHDSLGRHTSPINYHPVYVNEDSLNSKRNALQNPAYAKMRAQEVSISEPSSVVSSPEHTASYSNPIYTKSSAATKLPEPYGLMSESFKESDEYTMHSPLTPRTPVRQIHFTSPASPGTPTTPTNVPDMSPPQSPPESPPRYDDILETCIPSPHDQIEDDEDADDDDEDVPATRKRVTATTAAAASEASSSDKRKPKHDYENCKSRNQPQLDPHRRILRNPNNRGGSVKNNIVKRNSIFINNRSSDIELCNAKQDIINTTWKVNNSKVGQGGNGEIYKALTLDGKQVVMKLIKMRNRRGIHSVVADYSKKVEEINCLKMLKHPNIVKYYGAYFRKEYILIFMQYIANGSLTSVIENFGRLSELISANYTKQLLDAIEYMHSMKIVHRDIKCANILVTDDGVIKLIDFGCAKKNQSLSERRCNSDVGTSGFRSPESITGIGHGMKTDIWSLGCAVVEMLTGEKPWSADLHEFNITWATGVGDKPKLNRQLQTGEKVEFSDKANAFVKECFKDIKERKNATEMKLMSFVSIKNILMPNLSGRKIDDILNLDKVLER